MADLDRVSMILQDTIDHFDDPDMTVAALLRKCQRIASLRGDAANLMWMSLESTDVNPAQQNSDRDSLAKKLLEQLPVQDRARIADTEIRPYFQRRALPPPSDKIYARSVQEIELLVRTVREHEAHLTVPDGMHPQDLGLRLLRHDRERPKLVDTRMPLEAILGRIKTALWDFLFETEWKLTFGEASAETFDRLRSYVDQQLTLIAPPALKQFQAAYRRLKEGTPEDRAHAVTSCRRVLKTLADELYPARDEQVEGSDGKLRDVKDNNFVNRISQFVFESVGSHQNSPVVQAAVDDVGQRVYALNGLASAGLHAEIGEYEVDSCVVQTYLVVADLLRIRERRQAAIPQSPDVGNNM